MRNIKKPDLNAPRFRNKRKTVITRDKLKLFKKKHPEHSEITFKEFKKIIMAFNNNMMEGVIDNRDGIELPAGLGFIFMGTCPPAKKQNIDFVKSIKYGIKTTYKNWDSDNKLMKIFYTNHTTKYPFSNKQVWSFKAVKTFRKKASDAYKKNWAKYIEVDPMQKISAMYDKYRKKDIAKSFRPNIPEGYDEFKL